jgi:CRP-like cAMP-binding protein
LSLWETRPTRFLTLRRQAFEKIMRGQPQIALHAGRMLSVRIRRLHATISNQKL